MKSDKQKLYHAIYMREWRKRNPDAIREYMRAWKMKNKKRYQGTRRAERKRYSEKVRGTMRLKCWLLFDSAVRRGKILRKKSCSRCRGRGRIEAHHHDYAKPLKVIWVCTKCHAHIHKLESAGKLRPILNKTTPLTPPA